MPRRFARGDTIIVAAAATAVHRVVVDTRDDIPVCATAMTRRAIVAGIDMVRRFSRCRHHAARRVTTRAMARRAFELPAHVAAFAR